MSRPRKASPSGVESYNRELRDAMSEFLPHQGLPLLSDDGRVRWTGRMLAMAAVLMAWSGCPTLLDRFTQARALLVEVYRTRRRPGVAVLVALCEHWRRCVGKVAGEHWRVEGWLLFGVDGSKFDCPRTVANEE